MGEVKARTFRQLRRYSSLATRVLRSPVQLPDPAHLLQGTGKFMRHVKLRTGAATNAAALSRLIGAAYEDIKARVEHG
jgi:hypothetical protein